jgi:deoxyribose-phosphate aldolase
MKLTVAQLARMIDLSAVRADVTIEEICRLADVARKYRCVCTFVMPGYLPELRGMLADAPDVGIGGVVGFPSGAPSTATKVAEARQQVSQGAAELDMVINIGMLLSGRDQYVEDDIRAVVDAAGSVPVKVILEVHYLSDEQIIRACEIAVRAGVAYVKTGTGWAPTGATLHNVALMKSTVGDRVKVKAAGGIRDLDTVVKMIGRGVSRFGVGLDAGVKILEQCAALPGGTVEV